MRFTSLLTSLLACLLAGLAVVASAKPDASSPELYQREARFSSRYKPDFVPDRPPHLLRRAPIAYPAKWRQWGQPAYAVVDFLVEDTGAPTEIQCTEATDKAFAKAAEKAISQSYFVPALKNQQGVWSRMSLRLEFSPTPPPAAPTGANQPSPTPAP